VHRGPKTCDLSKGIETDAAARTITLHLTAPDPELLYALALPVAALVPADHPFGRTDLPPTTGPYRVADFDVRRELRLVRNTRFRMWSRDARPDGFADQIVIRFRDRSRFGDEIRIVQRQEADLAEVSGPFGSPTTPAQLEAIRSESAPQLHTDAVAELDAMLANTAVPPFDDVRVRQALNYATDRRRAVRFAGGSDIAEPACQLLPVSFPGYEPPCRYTRNPGRAGGWIARTWRPRAV
jgi:peptide/nickel transport system substrate-binding protein